MANKERNKRSARKARSAERAAQEAASEEQSSGGISKSTRDQLVKAQKAKAKSSSRPSMLTRISDYFSSVGSELRRVVWPSRQELRDYSIGVILTLVIVGLAIWLVDTGIVLALTGISSLGG